MQTGVKLLLIAGIITTIIFASILAAPYFNSVIDFQDRRTIVVTAKMFEFDPRIIEVYYGEHIELLMSSIDVVHGFELREFGIYNHQIPVGQNTSVKFTANQLGVFYFYCTVFCGTGHSDHYGELHVLPAPEDD
jgi:cytochrome c oxidase subunit II